MSDVQNAQYYMTLVDRLASYHELVVFRGRYYPLMKQTLSQADYLAVKDRWNKKALDPDLPVAPDRVTEG